MGMMMSFLGKGGPPPSTQVIGLLMGTLYKQFVEKDITGFDDFHISVLDIFNTFNSALPGKHFDVPSRGDIEGCYGRWKEAKGANKKKVFVKFVSEKVNLSKLDDYTVITGIVTPPAAMAVKRAGENLPQLKALKAIPDVVFVPSATVLALISAKLSRRIFLRSLTPSSGASMNEEGKRRAEEEEEKEEEIYRAGREEIYKSERVDEEFPYISFDRIVQ